MILVRDVLQIEFGKMKQALELWNNGGAAIAERHGRAEFRVLTDLTGPYYTFVLESTYENLGDFEKGMMSRHGSEEWAEWYRGFQPLLTGGRREIFRIVE